MIASKIKGGMKRTTALKIAALLREILNHAVEDHHIAINPATRIGRFYCGRTEEEARPTVDPFTAEELTQLLAACRRWYPEWLELTATAAWTGLRQGEILGLRWGDIDFAGRLIEVRRTVSYGGQALRTGSPKSGRSRRVDLRGVLADWLQARESLQEAETARRIVPRSAVEVAKKTGAGGGS